MKKKRVSAPGGRERIAAWEHFAALAFGGVIVLGVLAAAGTLNSGYHFMDDHELIRMEHGFRVGGGSLWETVALWLKNDLRWRFRPMYWVERVFLAYVFGSDMLCWNIYTAVQGILSCYLLYFAARFTKNGRVISALFAAVVILGPQFTPWYRSANQENTGLLLCALTVWLIAFEHYGRPGRRKWLDALIVLSAAVCGLMKESFTLFMPAFVMLKVWLEYCEAGDFRQSVRKNLAPCSAVLAAMLFNLYCILFVVGVDNVSYAGFHSQTPPAEYIRGIGESLFVYLDRYTYMGIVFALLAVMCHFLIDKGQARRYAGFLVTGGYVMASQLLAHASSRMWERYIIPYILGWALVFVLLGYRMFEKDRIQRCVYVGLLLFLLLREFPGVYLGAKSYAEDGRRLGELLQCVEENLAPEDQVIGVFDAEEMNLAVASWLEAGGYVKMYSYDGASDALTDTIQFAAENGEPGDWSRAKAAVCHSWNAGLAAERMGLGSEEEYRICTFGDYCVVLKNF